MNLHKNSRNLASYLAAFVTISGLIFLASASAPRKTFAQGWVSCMWGPGDVCTSASELCEREYKPPDDWISQCRNYQTQSTCNSARLDCVYDPQGDTCGGNNEPCCGTTPPLYCDSGFEASDPHDLTNCICQPEEEEKETGYCPGECKPAGTTPSEEAMEIWGEGKAAGCKDGEVCWVYIWESPTPKEYPAVSTGLGLIPTNPEGLVSWFLHYARLIAGGIAFALLLYGGILFITAQGDEEKVEEARKTITSALTGLLVIIFATLILKIIGYDILKLPGWSSGNGVLTIPSN